MNQLTGKMKEQIKQTAYIDSNGDVWKRIDIGSRTEYEQIKPFLGCIAVFEENCPMKYPVRDLSWQDYHNYVYKGIKINSNL